MNVDFKAKQREFSAYIRDPDNNPAPTDVKEQRIAMYRELFFNNIDNFLSSNFPVLRKILDDQQWFGLAQDFFARHQCKTPYFTGIPEEFLAFLQNERSNADDFPFLLELAHYEWVEMALSIAREVCLADHHQSPEHLLGQRLQVSPLAWPLVYRYPVHKIAPAFLPVEAPAEPTFLIVYRDPLDEVLFLEITPMTYRLLEIIQQSDRLLTQDCLTQLADEFPNANREAITAGGLQILNALHEKTIIRRHVET
ncbi:MAG: putative DNA-binding domain-containing protein [Methylovulum sp.]|nr:putative DNA-binding domain-containing protein [Methylovulum sp.]